MNRALGLALTAFAFVIVLVGCATPRLAEEGGPAAAGTPALSGTITIDGSSTIFPVAQALVESFAGRHPDVRVQIANAGTGAGFQKFSRGEIDIATASRPIKAEEVEAARNGGIEFVELPMAGDGISIVVNPQNTWLKGITIEQLQKIWNKDSTVRTWNEVDPSWPSTPIRLYGPTTAHGTYEFFNEAVNGDKANSRQDYEQCADYQVLVAGVSRDPNALGYVGFAYVLQNEGKIRAIPVDGGNGPVAPTLDTIQNGTYTPLSRPLLIYVSAKALDRPEVAAFAEYVLTDGKAAVESQGFIPLPDNIYALVRENLKDRVLGTRMAAFEPGMSLEEVLREKVAPGEKSN